MKNKRLKWFKDGEEIPASAVALDFRCVKKRISYYLYEVFDEPLETRNLGTPTNSCTHKWFHDPDMHRPGTSECSYCGVRLNNENQEA